MEMGVSEGSQSHHQACTRYQGTTHRSKGHGERHTSLHAQLCSGDLLLFLASCAFGIFSLRLLLFLWEGSVHDFLLYWISRLSAV